jgi:hypothetical protein
MPSAIEIGSAGSARLKHVEQEQREEEAGDHGDKARVHSRHVGQRSAAHQHRVEHKITQTQLNALAALGRRQFVRIGGGARRCLVGRVVATHASWLLALLVLLVRLRRLLLRAHHRRGHGAFNVERVGVENGACGGFGRAGVVVVVETVVCSVAHHEHPNCGRVEQRRNVLVALDSGVEQHLERTFGTEDGKQVVDRDDGENDPRRPLGQLREHSGHEHADDHEIGLLQFGRRVPEDGDEPAHGKVPEQVGERDPVERPVRGANKQVEHKAAESGEQQAGGGQQPAVNDLEAAVFVQQDEGGRGDENADEHNGAGDESTGDLLRLIGSRGSVLVEENLAVEMNWTSE